MPRSADGLVLRLAFIYAGIFLAIGVQHPFLPAWMAAMGLDQQAIGTVLALATVARVAVVPFTTRVVDRILPLHSAIMLGATIAALSVTMLGLAGSATAAGTIYVLAAALSATTLPLIEAYALQALAQRAVTYGPVRLWGSVAYIAGTIGAGILFAKIAELHFIWAIVAAYWLAALTTLGLRPSRGLQADAKLTPTPVSLQGLAGSRVFLMVIAVSALVQGSHAVFYAFSTLQWKAAGLDGTVIGTLWALGVVAEIALFAASARLPPSITPAVLLAIGAAGAALRWAAMAIDPPAALLPVLQCLHALSFGATHLGAVQFVAHTAPAGLAASAQGILAAANGLLLAAATFGAGYLDPTGNLRGYGVMALLAAVGAMLAFGVVGSTRKQRLSCS